MQKLPLVPLTLLALFLAPLEAFGQQPCTGALASSRQRPGNDDLFIFLDSSLSMGPTSFGPWARGYFDPVRKVLHQLADCYLKEGDFVLVATFDSEARVDIAQEIRRPQRDLETLHAQIEGLGPSRPRYWERQADGSRGPEVAFPNPGRNLIVGGSLRTDLGIMLDLARRSLEKYRQPDHRQLVLLFTDGEHDPPEFSPYRNRNIRLDDFFPQAGVGRHRFGLVAFPNSEGRLDPALQQLVDNWGAKPDAPVEVMKVSDRAGAKPLFEQIFQLINRRIDLLAPEFLDLGRQVSPEIDQELGVKNLSPAAQKVRLRQAVFVLDRSPETPIPLEVEPGELLVGAGETVPIRVRGEIQGLEKGAYIGTIRFEFDGPIRFDPAQVAVRGSRVPWLEAYWRPLVTIVVLIAAAVAAVVWFRRRPVWVVMTWSRGAEVQVAPSRALAVGKTLRFGSVPKGGLHVDGPGRILGTLWRRGIDDYRIAWSHEAALTGPPSDDWPPLASGQEHPIGTDGKEWVAFYIQKTRAEAQELAKGLRPASSAYSDLGTGAAAGYGNRF